MHQGTDKIAANHPLCPLEKMAERLKSLCGIEKTNGCQKFSLILNRLGVVAAPRDGHGISMSLAEIDVHDLDQFSAVFGGAMRFILPSTVAFEHGPSKALRDSHALPQPFVVGVFEGLKICLVDGLLFRERAVNRVVNHVLADCLRAARGRNVLFFIEQLVLRWLGKLRGKVSFLASEVGPTIARFGLPRPLARNQKRNQINRQNVIALHLR